MGFYAVHVPDIHLGPFLTLKPGKKITKGFYMGKLANIASGDRYSIQAVASGDVNVRVWMSNIRDVPFTKLDLKEGSPPVITPDIGGLWMPCPSIPSFTVVEGENYFKQADFNDTCAHLAFELTASVPSGHDGSVDATGESTADVLFAMSLAFR